MEIAKNFIEKSILIHGDKYDYSKSNYIGSKSKILIICPIHGEFYQFPYMHSSGSGCPKCRKHELTTIRVAKYKSLFIERSIALYGDKYDYSQVVYIDTVTKVKITCKLHGDFYQTPNRHLKGVGCDYCRIRKTSSKNSNCAGKFIEKAKSIHGDKYDYSMSEYKSSKEKIAIICPECGVFFQQPNSHLSGHGCPSCPVIANHTTKSDFIESAKAIHNNLYNYNLVKYVNRSTKVAITCKKHGVFYQSPKSHIKGCGCPNCNSSKGEVIISNYLTNLNIPFESQKKFEKCLSSKGYNLRFDFYLPKKNMAIEYNGRQHYESVDFFGGDNQLKVQQINDKLKKDFCKKNNIKLIVISYKDNINKKLKENIV